MMKRCIVTLFCFISFYAIVSCSSRHVAEKHDTTPPTILSTSPLPNATNVAVSSAITIVFSEAMNSSTINDSTFFVMSASTGTVSGTVTYDTATNIATFTSNSVLEHYVAHRATITTGAQDTAGNALASSYNLIFSTIPAPGALDPAFGSNGRVRTDLGSYNSYNEAASAAAIQADGKILIAGYSTADTGSVYFTIARFLPNGRLDTTFGLLQNGKADSIKGRAKCMGLQSDGKIVTAGTSTNDTDALVARYKTDGTLDTNFNSTGTATFSMVTGTNVINSLAIQDDGKIVVVGEASSQGTTTNSAFMARFNADGTLDDTFATAGTRLDLLGDSSRAVVVKIQSNGMIVVGGNYQEGVGPKSVYLRRYNSAGNLDPLFKSGTVTPLMATDSILAAIDILPNGGNILVAGTTNIGSDDLFLMRYSSQGALDTTFGSAGSAIKDDVNQGSKTAVGLAVQADGKIIVAATFHPISGTVQTKDFALFRYDAEGKLDTTFGNGYGMTTTDFGSGYDDQAFAVGIQQDGKIIVVGESWNGSNYDVGICRYWP